MSRILLRSTPEAEGVSSRAILAFFREIRKFDAVHSFMIMRHGRVIAEAWNKPYAPELPHMLFSLSKSFTSCAVGFACAEGKLSLDTLLVDLFPEKLPDQIDEKFIRLRIRHLLSMSSGHDHCAMDDIGNAPDWEKAFFATMLAYEPGARFLYNSGATYMLSSALARVTGERLCAYLAPRLFEPLGITSRNWELSPAGIEVGGWGFHLTTEEIASFAQCLLDHGKRNGKQIIPSDYLDAATAFQSDNSMNDQPDWKVGYGFQFWRCQHNAFRGDGAFGQYAIVMPDQDMAIAVTSGLQNMQLLLNQVWEILLPAAGAEKLPESAGANVFRQESEAWSLPVLCSAGRALPHRCYDLKENELAFKTLGITSFDDRVELTLDGETLQAGFGRRLDNMLRWGEPAPLQMAASARWNSDHELELLVSCCETPFQWNFHLELGERSARLTRKSNLLFQRSEWPVLESR